MKKIKLLTRRNFYILFLLCVVFVAVAQRRSEVIVEFQENVQVRENRKATGKVNRIRDCEEEKRNVIFVKTHKTASSSVQNILLRYTVNHGLNLAMPRHNGARFFNPEPFRPDMVRPFYEEDEKSNVIANHLVASPELFQFIPDAFTFTILRSIPSLYESTFEYFKTSTKAFKSSKNIDEFYSSPEDFYSPGSHYNEYTKNHMAHDLGFDADSDDPKYFQKSIAIMEDRFDVVLISDYFLESMILLQEKLCLTLDEIVTLVVNAREKKLDLSESTTDNMKKWNSFDLYLFNHFNTTFWFELRKVPDLQKRKEILKKRTKALEEYCIAEERVCGYFDSSCGWQKSGANIKGFSLTEAGKKSPLCIDLTMPERPFLEKIAKLQWPFWKAFYWPSFLEF